MSILNHKIILLSCLIWQLLINPIYAQSYYIRFGAEGTNSGEDWINAFTSLPENLERGATYYIADGSYDAYTFDDPVEDDKYIIIKKATIDSHGIDTGWDDSFGNNQAIFDGYLLFETSYYEINGQTGGGPDNWDCGHGIKVQGTNYNRLIDLRGPAWYQQSLPNYITISHTEIEHRGLDNEESDDGVYMITSGHDIGSQYVQIDHCYFHDFGRMPLCVKNARYWIFEYNYVARNSSSAAQHSEGWQDFGSDDIIICHNIFEDIEGTSFIAMKKNWDQQNDNWSIYGNVFYYTPQSNREGIGGNGTIGATNESEAPCNNIRIYNNSFINIPGLNTGIYFPYGTGNQIYNNIWYRCRTNTITLHGDHDYNWFYDNWRITPEVHHDPELVASETNGQEGTGDPFVAWEELDFRLNSATNPGMILGDDYIFDANNNKRGDDSVWDRGAFEFVSGQTSAIPDLYMNSESQVYPNPTTGKIRIKNIEAITCRIYNLSGQKILSTNKKVIDLSGNPTGIYIIKIVNSDQKVYSNKIILKTD